MYLTISKKFEVSLSFRYWRSGWPERKNRAVFGEFAGNEHGFGGNWQFFVGYAGSVDPTTGMLVNVAEIKKKVGAILAERYDHKYLNVDTKPFDIIVPSPEMVAGEFLSEVEPLQINGSAQPSFVHLNVSPTSEATAYSDGRIERHLWTDFSAARVTRSPHLSDVENRELFGISAAPSGHGHHYFLRVTLSGRVEPDSGMIVRDTDSYGALSEIYDLLEHKNLSLDIKELLEMPITTECLARFICQRLTEKHELPVMRVRLWENPWFSVEYHKDGTAVMILQDYFHAAHRLHSRHLTDTENLHIYGKCNNPAGHGHRYLVEASWDGAIDERTGIVFPLMKMKGSITGALKPWAFKHLEYDTGDFDDRPSTGENIVRALWPRIESESEERLYRLRLWETPNNRFTLRREMKAAV